MYRLISFARKGRLCALASSRPKSTLMSALSRRSLLLLAGTSLFILAAFGIEWNLSLTSGRPFGHTQSGHVVGWVGFACIVLTCVYPIKKRSRRHPGWPKRWFQAHMIFGVFGPLVIVVHSGAHFHALVPIAAMFAMAIVVLSGVVGQVLHYLAFREVNDYRRELAAQGLSETDIESQIHSLAHREEALRLWQCIHGPVTAIFVVLTLMHIGAALYFGGL